MATVKQAELEELRLTLTARCAADELVRQLEATVVASLDHDVSLGEGAVPGGPVLDLALQIGTMLLEDAIQRRIAALSVQQ